MMIHVKVRLGAEGGWDGPQLGVIMTPADRPIVVPLTEDTVMDS